MGIKSIFSLGFIALFCVSVTTSGLLDTVTDLVDDVLDDLLGNDYDEPQESQEEPQEPPGICAQLVGHSSLETCVFPTVQDMTTFNKKNYCINYQQVIVPESQCNTPCACFKPPRVNV